MLRFTDNLTGDKTEFVPRDPGKASVYWCGPTVYDLPHLGHARSTLAFDVLVRYLRWSGYEVCSASNITDIDDKIIARAASEGSTEPELAARFEKAFIDQMDLLNIAHPDLRPRATEYLEQIISAAPAWLMGGGALILELSPEQAVPMADHASSAGFVDVEVRPDLTGRPRALVARRP